MSDVAGVDQAGRPDPEQIATRQDFARELSRLRERAGLTVRDVARAVGIRDSTAGGYFSGRHLPGLRSMALLGDIVRICGVTDPGEVESWAQALLRVRRNPGPRPLDEPVPYRGLATFEPEDERWFRGREALTEVLVDRVRRCGTGSPPLVVTGPSGSGKSSLLRAGLVPALRKERLPDGTAAWDCRLLVPGEHPARRLLEALTEEAVPTGFLPGTAELEAAAADAQRRLRPARLLLVIDQFEEIFTACADPAERQMAVTAVVAVAARVAVVVGLRGDFWAAAARQPGLIPALQHHQIVVGPMTEDDLRRTITEPARLASLELEDGLAQLILRDARSDAGALPLLSHALLATWRRHQRGRLTVADYLGTGGIAGAIAQTAETIYQELLPDEQDLARRMFLRLVHVDDDAADTRRRVDPEELLGDGSDAAAAEALLDRYVEQRLVTVDQNTVEITHEALLSAWPRLRGWVQADRAGLRVHRQLTDAARIWQQSDQDPNTLLRGGRLVTAAEWAADPEHRRALNSAERDFLAASTEVAARERSAQRRRDRRLRALLAAACALLLVSGALAGYLVDQRRSADRQRDEAISRRVATDSDRLRDTDRSLAMQLALAAYRIAPTREARSALVDSSAVVPATRLLAGFGVLQAVAVTADRRTVAAGGAGGRVRFWDLDDRRRPRLLAASVPGSTGTTPTVFAVVAAPHGRSLATGGSDGQVRLWDLADPARPQELASVTGSTGELPTVFAIAYAPDGGTLAAGGADGLVRLWDVRDPAKPRPLGVLRGPSGYVQALAFSPGGRVLAAGSADHLVYRWDVRRRALLGQPLRGAAKSVLAVAFSPDGTLLAAGSADKAVYLWTVTAQLRPAAQPPLTGATSWINSVAFSPDSRELAAGGSDNAVRLWRLSGGRGIVATLPHPGPVTAVTYTDHGRTLATSGADGTVRLWRLPGPMLTDQADSVFSVQYTDGGRRLAVSGGSRDNAVRFWNVVDPRAPAPTGRPILGPPGDQQRFTGAMAVSPDGGTVATGSVDGSVRLWDGSAATVLRGPTGVIESIAFSPDGHRVAASSDDHRVWLWQIDGRRLAVLTGATNYVYGVAFDPSGRWLAAGSADYAVRLWDTSRSGSGPAATLHGPASYVWSVAFSPDGARLAAASADSRVWLWNVRDPAQPRAEPPLTGPTNYVYGVQFSRSGRMLAAVSGDRSVWAWDTSDPGGRPQLQLRLTGAGDSVLVSDFRPDGAWLAAGTADGTVRMWNLDLEQGAEFICAIAGDPITPEEWERYVTGAPYRPPCP